MTWGYKSFESLLRSDWTISRGGAVLFNGAEDCTVSDCESDHVGGNAIFVNNSSKESTAARCTMSGSFSMPSARLPLASRSS